MSVLFTQTKDTVVLIFFQIIQLVDNGCDNKKNIPVEAMSERPTSCLSIIIHVLVAYQYLQRKTFMLYLSTNDYF